MEKKKKFLAPVLLAAAAAAAIAVAPIAAADTTTPDQSSCTDATPGSICQTPGNVEINDSPGPVQYQPQYPYWEGGFGSYGHHGGHR